MKDKTEQRLMELEVTLSHQQRLIEQLNEVVTDQSQQLIGYKRIVQDLQEQLKELKAAMRDGPAADPNERPPHY